MSVILRFMVARRLLLTALLLASLAIALLGCAEYEIRQPMAERGTVLLTWEVAPERVYGNHCGIAQEIARGHWLLTFRRAYDFNSVCIFHELAHAMGARHQ